MYTDPGDQSVWIYHRWLVGRGALKGVDVLIISSNIIRTPGEDYEVLWREIASIQELLGEQPDSKCAASVYLADIKNIDRDYRVHGITCVLQTASATEPLVPSDRI